MAFSAPLVLQSTEAGSVEFVVLLVEVLVKLEVVELEVDAFAELNIFNVYNDENSAALRSEN